MTLVAQSHSPSDQWLISSIKECIQASRSDLESSEILFDSIANEIGQRQNLSDSLIALFYYRWGIKNYLSDEYESAFDHYEQSLTLRKQIHHHQHPDIARTLLNQGIAMKYAERYALAESKLKDACERYTLIGDQRKLAQSLFEYGWVKRNQGDFEIAILQQQEALNTYSDIYPGDHYDVAFTNQQLGVTLDEAGRHEEAIEAYNRAIEIYRNIDDIGGVADTYHNLGNAYNRTGQHSLAKEALFTSLKINLTYGEDGLSYVAKDYDDLGLTFKYAGQLDTALFYADRALSIRKRIMKHGPELAISYVNIGTIYAARNKHVKALSFYDSAMYQLYPDTVAYLPDHFDINQIQIPTYAIAILQDRMRSAIAIAREVKSETTESDILNTVSYLDQLIAQLQSDFSLLQSKVFWVSQMREINLLLLDYYQERFQTSGDDRWAYDALEVIEKSKNLILLEQFLQSHWKSDPSLALRRQRENYLQSQYAKWTSTMDRSGTQDSILYYATLLNQWRDEMQTDYPNVFEMPDVKNSIQDFVRSLSEKSGAIDFLMGDDHIYLIQLTSDAIDYQKIRQSDFPEERMDKLIQWMRSPGQPNASEDIVAELSRLYDLFIGSSLRSKEQLVIFPDGWIHYLPMDILMTSQSFHDYAIRNHSFAYHFSIPLCLQSLNSKREISAGSSVAMIAPNYVQHQTLPQLNGSNEEWKTLQAAFDNHLYFEFIDPSNAEMLNASVLHLSTHAFADTNQLYQSYLAFPNGQSDVTRVYDWMLQSYDWNNQLVVLAGCETGLGKYIIGEGLFSLARSFFEAGVPSSIMSQWKSNDASTAHILNNFYLLVAQGVAPQTALQSAKVMYIEEPLDENAHPYYWAHLQYWGSSLSQKKNAWPWYGAGAFLILSLFVYYRFRKS